MDFPVGFGIDMIFLLIYSDAIVLPGKVYDECIDCRSYIMQPLFITFSSQMPDS